METNANAVHREPWNKGKIVGQKAPFKLKNIWALRVRLQIRVFPSCIHDSPRLGTRPFARILEGGVEKLESTARYLGIEVHDALEISEQTEI